MIEIIQGNNIKSLRTLESQSVNTCVTSPPYFGLRDYGTGTWIGGDENCPHKRTTKISKATATGHKGMNDKGHVVGDAIFKQECPKCGAIREDEQLGLEASPKEFVENLVNLFREIKRVLRDDGTVWLNLGDTYCGTGHKGEHLDPKNKEGRNAQKQAVNNSLEGFKSKDLIGIPWRVAFALQEDGWYLRQDIIWHKPNPMPESVRDRCTKAHEYIFLLSKKNKYYYDYEAIKEDSKYYGKDKRSDKGNIRYEGKRSEHSDSRVQQSFVTINPKKNKRSVWTVTTKPYKGAHFATFPMDLIEPCVLAGCPEKVCVDCNEPYQRKVESKRLKRNELPKDDPRYRPNTYEGSYKDINGKADAGYTETKDLGLEKQCKCETNETKAGTVLDPFGGAGTTGVVAENNKRNAVLLELNPEYIEIAEERIAKNREAIAQAEYEENLQAKFDF